MQKIIEFFEWLSGKKMAIGSVLLWLAYVGLPFIMQDLGFDPAWLGTVISIFAWLGGILTPIGAAHKLAKTKKH